MKHLLNKTHNIHYLKLLTQIPDKSINLITSDFPYGTTQNDWDKPFPLNDYMEMGETGYEKDEFFAYMFSRGYEKDFMEDEWNTKHKKGIWFHYERIIKDDGAILLYAQAPYDKILACSNLDLFRYEWIWEKTQATGFLNAEKMPMKAHENILVFYKKLPTYNPIKTKGHDKKESKKSSKIKCKQSTNYNSHKDFKDYCSEERYPRSVLKFPTDKQKERLHPTQKPIELQKYLIKTYSNEGDIVHDSCSGSGTTECACIVLNRNFICSENKKEFWDESQKRQKKYRGEIGLFESKVEAS